MAQFRNVSGQDFDLSLPEWLNKRRVENGAVVDVDDDLVAAHLEDVGRNYFNPDLWERADAPDNDENGGN